MVYHEILPTLNLNVFVQFVGIIIMSCLIFHITGPLWGGWGALVTNGFPYTGSVMWGTRGSWGQDHHDLRTITHPTDCIPKVISKSVIVGSFQYLAYLCGFSMLKVLQTQVFCLGDFWMGSGWTECITMWFLLSSLLPRKEFCKGISQSVILDLRVIVF